jgi:sugar phosphate isomerase/epimerase
MKLAVSTASFGRAFQEKKLTLLDFPEVCARAGLEAIELNDFCHAKIWDVTDDLREPTLDYDRFFALLRKVDYQGPISIEFMGKRDVMEMLSKCVALLKRCRAGQH